MGVLALLFDVLFVGHSLVGPNLPTLTDAALRAMGQPARVQAQIINGATLAYNWDHSAQAEGVDARAILTASGTDVLILTEAQPVAMAVKWSDTATHAADFAKLAQAANPQVRVYLYETWPSLNSGPGNVTKDDPDAELPWRQRIDKDAALWQSIMRDTAARSGVAVGIIPAGQAMAAMADAIAAGKARGLTSINDLFVDDIHPNGKGLYFVAMVQAAAITGKSPKGLPAKITRSWQSRDAILSPELANMMQEIAWQVVEAAPVAAKETVTPPENTPPAPEAAASTTSNPVPAIEPMPSFAPITNPDLAIGLAGVNDWSVQQPFLNIMKTARPWIGHLPGQWGGWGHDDLAKAGALGPGGWPLRLPPELTGISTLILTDLPAEAAGMAGRYLLTYSGKGTLKVEGRAAIVEAAAGSISFDYTPGNGGVLITLAAIDPADPIRDLTVVRADRATALAAGEIFNPDWLARLRGVKGLRFMDWMQTNDSPLAHDADRPLAEDYTYARIGVPAEVMVALANQLKADAWFTLPHLSDDTLVRHYAEIAHDGLNPGLKAQVEFSNEVWNWQFAQSRWAEEQGKARWQQDHTWVQFYALRASQVADIWAEVFADDPSRLVRIVSVQTGWLGLEQQILDAPLVMAETGQAPAMSFDAYAVTGYFSALLGSDQKTAIVKDWLARSEQAAKSAVPANGTDAYIAAHRYDLAVDLAAQELRDGSVTQDPTDSVAQVLSEILPYHAAVAADHGLRLMMYEGGSHVVGYGAQADDPALTDFFTYLNFTPQMGALYTQMMQGWHLQSDAPFNAFVDVYRPGKWGSWGALRHLGDDNPRWEALAIGCPTC